MRKQITAVKYKDDAVLADSEGALRRPPLANNFTINPLKVQRDPDLKGNSTVEHKSSEFNYSLDQDRVDY